MSEPEWVAIPAGEFWMGSADGDEDELPIHHVHLPTFYITRTPVTNAQYFEFVRAAQHPTPGHWVNEIMPVALAQHPVTYVDWFDANAFAAWANGRLPTEAEWEKAARGADARLYPWGNDVGDASYAHYAQDVKHIATCSVFAYARGASPYGVLDMAGNVWEWVSTVHQAYPYRADDGRELFTSPGERVLRGGSFYSGGAKFIHCTTRSSSFPTRRRDHIGFRVACSIEQQI